MSAVHGAFRLRSPPHSTTGSTLALSRSIRSLRIRFVSSILRTTGSTPLTAPPSLRAAELLAKTVARVLCEEERSLSVFDPRVKPLTTRDLRRCLGGGFGREHHDLGPAFGRHFGPVRVALPDGFPKFSFVHRHCERRQRGMVARQSRHHGMEGEHVTFRSFDQRHVTIRLEELGAGGRSQGPISCTNPLRREGRPGDRKSGPGIESRESCLLPLITNACQRATMLILALVRRYSGL